MTEKVNFKVQSNRNEEVYVEGFVEIHDDLAEDVDWFYYDAQGFATPRMFVEHDGVDGFKGATEEQVWEVEQFRGDYGQDAFWIDTCILQSEEDENRTYVRENCTLIINQGAKMESKIEKYHEGDFLVEVVPIYNGHAQRSIFDYMIQNNLDFDPYCISDENWTIENGKLVFEISKDYFEDDEIELNEKLINGEFQIIFQAMLFSQIDFEDDLFEQMLDTTLLDNDELFDLYSWARGKITAQEFADRNGYEWEVI